MAAEQDTFRDWLKSQSPEELALIEQKMSQLGTVNREAYLRKMALDGYVVKLDLPELKELVSLLRRSSNNLNQLTVGFGKGFTVCNLRAMRQFYCLFPIRHTLCAEMYIFNLLHTVERSELVLLSAFDACSG